MKNLLCSLLFLSVSGLTFAQSSKKENEVIIKSLRATSNEAIANQNVEVISSFWLPDFVQVRGNGTYQVGKDTIAALWRRSFKENPKVSYTRNPSEIIISNTDSLAWESGTWIGINSYSKGGKYSAMWKKRKGVWKLQSELFVALQ